MTAAVILGTLSASDARAAHLANCTRLADLGPAADEPAAGPASCCPEPAGVAAESDPVIGETCLVADACSCCTHPTPGHLGEEDSRLPAESNGSALDLVVVASDFPYEPAASVPTARAIASADCPLPAARLFLLLGHLRF